MQSLPEAKAMIALMGATGTGKSSFINLLTSDDGIRVGHDLDSATLDVNTSVYFDEETRVPVTLVDTPGFDDSREGVSDSDILEKIASFLQDGEGQKLNGIVYLHRISDPRFSGMAKKNLRVFRELCGDDKLGHVRIVTTFWNVVSAKDGEDHEAALAAGVFKPFLDAGAKLVRHDNGLESAKKIVSDLTRQVPVTMKIQEELNTGMVLGDTSAGAVIIEEMKELQKKHAQEMEELKKELEDAVNENDDDLRAELDAERKKLAEKIARVEEDRKRMSTMQTTQIMDHGSAEHRELDNAPEQGSTAPQPSVREVLERIGENTDALRREREELQREIARLDAETAMLKKALSQLSQEEDARENEAVNAAVKRALEERSYYANRAMKLAKLIPFVPKIISEPVLGGMGYSLDIVRSRFHQ